MRILLFSHAYTVHMQRWHQGLRARGHQVRVLVRMPATGPGVVAPPAALTRVNRLRQAWLAAAWLRLCGGFRPEVLHQHWFEVPRLAPLFPARTPLVISTWGADIVRTWADPELAPARAYAARAAVVLGSSQFLADEAARVLARPVECLYWGVDLARFTPGPRPQGPFVIGFLKHLEPKYGPEVALEAFAQVKREVPDAELHLYGQGSLRASLEARARALGLLDAVRFFGTVSAVQVPAAIATFHVMVMPSTDPSETLGVAALEAQAMGVPVVASRIGGVPEAVRDGVGGLLTPPNDPAALADALLRLARDPALCACLGAGGRAHVVEQFDWESTLDRMQDIYHRVLAGGPSHG